VLIRSYSPPFLINTKYISVKIIINHLYVKIFRIRQIKYNDGRVVTAGTITKAQENAIVNALGA
jgi:hypothetical protein